MFMDGSMSPNDHDYYNIICCIIQYVESHNCISNIFVAVSYINYVSQSNSFLLLLFLLLLSRRNTSQTILKSSIRL